MHKINDWFIICDMETIIQKQKSGSIKPAELPDWMVSHGLSVITTEECSHLMGVPTTQVPQRLIRLRDKGKIVSAARGLWIVVSPQFREMGAPEPIQYIHRLMSFYHCEYCIGWLSAAALSGVSHQAPQVFQIATDKILRDRTIGRSRLQFFHRSYVGRISRKRVVTSDGAAISCTPAVTMLMVSTDLKISAGINNAATIVSELAQEYNDYMDDLMDNLSYFPDSAVCRLGWILDHVAGESGLEELADYCSKASSLSLLAPGGSRNGKIDKRWNIIENREVEADI